MRLLALPAALVLLPALACAGGMDDLFGLAGGSSMGGAPAVVGRPVRQPRSAVVGWDLNEAKDELWTTPSGRGALVAIGGFDPRREPLILVHGIMGAPKDLQPVSDVLRGGRYQQFAFAYRDFNGGPAKGGLDLAAEISRLSRAVGPGRKLTIVAHSMGGLTTRAALNELDRSGEGRRWAAIRVIAVDSPWHGYGGPGFQMTLPGALNDMQAKSSMFEDGLLRRPLADNVALELAFAQSSTEVYDYTEAPLDGLPAKIADSIRRDARIEGEQPVLNFWHALVWSSEFRSFHDELEAKGAALTEADVKAALASHYPRYPGDHMSVLSRTGPGSFLARLVAELEP